MGHLIYLELGMSLVFSTPLPQCHDTQVDTTVYAVKIDTAAYPEWGRRKLLSTPR
jgi:hypothetical protein